MLQPDPVTTGNVTAQLALAGQAGKATSDLATRLAQALSLRVSALTYSGQPGQRVMLGCSAALARAAVAGARRDHLRRQNRADRALDHRHHPAPGAGLELGVARQHKFRGPRRHRPGRRPYRPDRLGGDLGARRPAPRRDCPHLLRRRRPETRGRRVPRRAEPQLHGHARIRRAPARQDPPLELPLLLPAATPPAQTPQLASAGIALSPYTPAADYSSTTPRRRALWLEFTAPVTDPGDGYFARVLAYAPDQMLTGAPFGGPGGVTPPPEPPLAIDPELIRTIVPGQSDDHAGLSAMQPLVPSSSPLHYMLPLPAGLAVDAPELFGFFVYELRAGHQSSWSTAQGHFGPPLRVAGVQHPAPPLLGVVSSLPATIGVSAPYATPAFAGRSLLPSQPRPSCGACCTRG